MATMQKLDYTDLEGIPGLGAEISADLRRLGIIEIPDLLGRDPEDLYGRMCIMRGTHVDRVVLYVLRSAVYFANTPRPEPELLKWQNWKDELRLS